MKQAGDERFDASIGLAFSLKAFEAYRKSGTLSAEIRSIPGMRGRHQAYLELVSGKVVGCYLTDQKGERQPIAKDLLIQLDEEKGPFGWVFQPDTATVPAAVLSPKSEAPQVVHSSPRFLIPVRLVQYIDPRQLQQWTYQQKQCLYAIFSLVDGSRNTEEIKAQVAFPSKMVDDGLHVLLRLRVIEMR